MISRQFTVFVLVGLLSAMVDIAVMQSLVMMGRHYSFSVTAGFAVGLVLNYFCHARFTFKADSSVPTVVRFAVVVLVNYLITLLCVMVSVHYWGDVLVGKVISLPLVALNGFALSRYWVFR